MKALLLKTLIFTHRYVGLAIGWLMLMWCLSGLVMLYVEYPELRDRERDAVAESIHLERCCKLSSDVLPENASVASVTLESLGERPALLIQPQTGASIYVYADTGDPVGAINADSALRSAMRFASTGDSQPSLLGQIDKDQWTVYPRYGAHLPLLHVALNDESGTEVYVSSSTGQVVQKTTRWQRFWNWLGAVPHWLYFTAIRQNAALWNTLVIYGALLGCFLVSFGIGLGVWQLRRKSDKQLHSPYRGWKYWHHVPGLIFGVLVLTWVFSGLMSMQPWGFLESHGASDEVQHLQGDLPRWDAIRRALQTMPTQLPPDTVRISSSVLHGRLYFVTTDRQGVRTRFDEQWRPAPLLTEELSQAKQTLGATQIEIMDHEDVFYYSIGSTDAPLPVVRATRADGTRYYLDPVDGAVLMKLDEAARGYRWLHSGLHRMDFTEWLRMRPIRDVWMWLLMIGVTTVCFTGLWLGVRYLRR